MMDEWESLRIKIKALETNFLRGPVTSGVPTMETPAAEFWKRKYEQERVDWEKAIESKAREQSTLQERYIKDEEGISLLTRKIQQLEKKLDTERFLWEEKSKTRILESEIEAVHKEWEHKTVSLMDQIKALQEQLDLAPEKSAEQVRTMDQLKSEKIKAEQTIKLLEEEIESKETENQTKFSGLKEEIKSLEETLSGLSKQKAQNQIKMAQLEEQVGFLREEKNRAFQRLESRKKELFSEFEDLMRGFSHRIKNHLGIMTGIFGETIQESNQNPESAGLFQKSAEELSKLVEEFVEFTRVPTLELHALDLNFLLARAVAHCRESIQAKKILLDKNFEVSIPKIKGNEALILKAFEEILFNAVDATPEGKVLKLSVEYLEKDRLLVVKIQDEGHGIPQDLSGKIFRPYFTTRKGRRGMGLARARRCMDHHHGTLELASTGSGGITATLEFPLP